MRAVIGSIAVHALLAWLAFHGDPEGTPHVTPTTATAITIIEPVEVALLPTAVPSSDGGAPAGSARSQARTTGRARMAAPDPRGTITIEHAGTDLGDGGVGLGGRGGTGTGTGFGFGDGATIQPPQLLTPPPAPRGEPPSKARPARLIYPARQREVEDAELFVARVIVDDDGFVAGAKMTRGFGGRRDEVASQMIWRFRYAPALDDGGRPIRSTLEQRFLVGP